MLPCHFSPYSSIYMSKGKIVQNVNANDSGLVLPLKSTCWHSPPKSDLSIYDALFQSRYLQN